MIGPDTIVPGGNPVVVGNCTPTGWMTGVTGCPITLEAAPAFGKFVLANCGTWREAAAGDAVSDNWPEGGIKLTAPADVA